MFPYMATLYENEETTTKKSSKEKQLLKALANHWEVIKAIYELEKFEEEEPYGSTIAKKLQLERPQISKKIKNLIHAGLVYIHKKEGRKKICRLTDEGVKLVETIKLLGSLPKERKNLKKPSKRMFYLITSTLDCQNDDRTRKKRIGSEILKALDNMDEESRARVMDMAKRDYQRMLQTTRIWELKELFWKDILGRVEKAERGFINGGKNVIEYRNDLLWSLGMLKEVFENTEQLNEDVVEYETRERVKKHVERFLQHAFLNKDGDVAGICVSILCRVIEAREERIELFKRYMKRVAGGNMEEFLKLRESGVLDSLYGLLPEERGDNEEYDLMKFFYSDVLSMEVGRDLYQWYRSRPGYVVVSGGDERGNRWEKERRF